MREQKKSPEKKEKSRGIRRCTLNMNHPGVRRTLLALIPTPVTVQSRIVQSGAEEEKGKEGREKNVRNAVS